MLSSGALVLPNRLKKPTQSRFRDKRIRNKKFLLKKKVNNKFFFTRQYQNKYIRPTLVIKISEPDKI
jgi:hypothetical protein